MQAVDGGGLGMAVNRNHLLLSLGSLSVTAPRLLSSALRGAQPHLSVCKGLGEKGILGRLTSCIWKLFVIGGDGSQLRPTGLVVLGLGINGG